MTNGEKFTEKTGIDMDVLLEKFQKLLTMPDSSNPKDFIDRVVGELTPQEIAGVLYIVTLTHPGV